jgi:hypothetical protein
MALHNWVIFFIGHLALEDETIMVSQNVRHQSPTDAAPYPGRMKMPHRTGFHELTICFVRRRAEYIKLFFFYSGFIKIVLVAIYTQKTCVQCCLIQV